MNTPTDNRCVLLFAKYPGRGTVKTRLSPYLQGIAVEELYRAFVLDTISLLEGIAIPFRICYYPEGARGRFITWLGSSFSFAPQVGANLGERMENCFRDAFSDGFDSVTALGTDIPDLPRHHIGDAFEGLQTHNSVLGPSEDGGYYLIGFNKDTFLPEVFHEINWGTEEVLSQTIKKLNMAGHQTYILPSWRDVDTYEDLQSLFQKGINTGFKTSNTMSLLLRAGAIT